MARIQSAPPHRIICGYLLRHCAEASISSDDAQTYRPKWREGFSSMRVDNGYTGRPRNRKPSGGAHCAFHAKLGHLCVASSIWHVARKNRLYILGIFLEDKHLERHAVS